MWGGEERNEEVSSFGCGKFVLTRKHSNKDAQLTAGYTSLGFRTQLLDGNLT